MTVCKQSDCNNHKYKKEKYCELHCPKSDKYHTDLGTGLLQDFHDKLVSHIVSQYHAYNQSASVEQEKMTMRDSLKGGDEDIYEKVINIKSIKFPHRDDRDQFDYVKLLNRFREVCISFCTLKPNWLYIDSKIFFDECRFESKWSLYNYDVLENVAEVIYQNCTFAQGVDGEGSLKKRLTLNNMQFRDCSILNSFVMDYVKCNASLFNDNSDPHARQEGQMEIGSINITNCVFSERFIFNNYKLKEFICKKSTFQKLEFKGNEVQVFSLDDCNFEGIVDSHGTTFKIFKAYKTIFNDFAVFEKSKFGDKSKDNQPLVIFKYVTFKDTVSFRSSEFFNGLDLRAINSTNQMNFYQAQIASDNTDRETYRIIKQSFDKVGNKIEANHYFSRELKEYRNELKQKKGNWQERIIFGINYYSSNFGQSFIQPVCFILGFSVLYMLIKTGYENNFLYEIYPACNPTISSVSGFVNKLVLNITPFKSLLTKGMEFISLCFNIIFSVLIWQTIIAAKRNTKR